MRFIGHWHEREQNNTLLLRCLSHQSRFFIRCLLILAVVYALRTISLLLFYCFYCWKCCYSPSLTQKYLSLPFASNFSPSFSNLENSSRNLDMQELDYNPSRKDLTDARIHHLLAEELKPRRVSAKEVQVAVQWKGILFFLSLFLRFAFRFNFRSRPFFVFQSSPTHLSFSLFLVSIPCWSSLSLTMWITRDIDWHLILMAISCKCWRKIEIFRGTGNDKNNSTCTFLLVLLLLSHLLLLLL